MQIVGGGGETARGEGEGGQICRLTLSLGRTHTELTDRAGQLYDIELHTQF